MKTLQTLGFAIALMASSLVHSQNWKPTKPVTIIVPWAAGGSTDQVTRITAAELEKHLGQKVVIVNQPGASGSIGSKNALEAPKDGYTWTAGAARDLGTYKVLGMLDTQIQDWHLFLNVANTSVVGVNANAPWKSMQELLDDMKAKPGQISVATAGLASAGHGAIEAIAKASGIKYRHVTYDGGAPAVVATVGGETQVTTQLAVEQADMIRAKRIRPLAVVGAKPLEIAGYGTIEPITRTLPGFNEPPNYFGIFIPKGVPQQLVATLERIWGDRIARAEALKKYAAERGALFDPQAGAAAQKAVMPAIQAYAWLMHEGGKTKVSPESVGIKRP